MRASHCCCRAAAAARPLQNRLRVASPASSRANQPQRRRGGVAMATARVPAPGDLRALLFDIDGTLTDTDHLHFRVFVDLLCELGYRGGEPIDRAFFARHISGKHNPDIFAFLFPERTAAEHDALAEEKEARFRSLAATALKPLPGLPQLLAWARRRGLRAVAVTNAPRANAELMLGALGLATAFEALIIGAECAAAKPDPEPYREGLRRLGARAEQAVAFEDSPTGMASAAGAGLATFGLLTGQREEALLAAGAVKCIRDYSDPALWEALSVEAPEAAELAVPAA